MAEKPYRTDRDANNPTCISHPVKSYFSWPLVIHNLGENYKKRHKILILKDKQKKLGHYVDVIDN